MKAVLIWTIFLATALTGAVPASAETLSFSSGGSGHIDMSRWYISNGWSNGPHQSCEWRADAVSLEKQTLQLRLSSKGGKVRPLGCSEIHTKTKTSYGRYEARMRTAAGSGLNTAFFTYAGPPAKISHDELDFEFIGKAPDTVDISVWTNGNISNGHAKRIALGFDASKGFHDYAFEWRPDKVSFYADGRLIYETGKGAPVPSNPGYLFFSLWSGSDMEDQWMGHFTYAGPVTAEVAETKFIPFSPAH